MGWVFLHVVPDYVLIAPQDKYDHSWQGVAESIFRIFGRYLGRDRRLSDSRPSEGSRAGEGGRPGFLNLGLEVLASGTFGAGV
jgi:hypothetical protein